MKRSTKIISIVIVFFFIITAVIVARTMIGNHFKKKFSKRPPPGIVVKVVEQKLFQNTIETFGTAVPAQIKSLAPARRSPLDPTHRSLQPRRSPNAGLRAKVPLANGQTDGRQFLCGHARDASRFDGKMPSLGRSQHRC